MTTKNTPIDREPKALKQLEAVDNVTAMLTPFDGWITLVEKQFEVWSALPNARDNLALRALAGEFRKRAARIAFMTQKLVEIFDTDETKRD